MRLLVDTHAVHWWLTGDPRLSSTARAAMAAGDNDLCVSVMTTYELALLYRRRRLLGREAELDRTLHRQGFEALPVTSEHALTAAALADVHGDPIDRVLVAQTLIERLTLVSKDRLLARYGVPVLW